MNQVFVLDNPNFIPNHTAEYDLEKPILPVLKQIVPKSPRNSKKFIAKRWLFRIRATNLKQDEVVCVSGNVPELGSWQVERCLQLQQEKDDKNIWFGTAIVPNQINIYYRYCVCVIVECGFQVMVRSWETHLNPRRIRPNEKSPLRTDEPYHYGEYGSTNKIDRGWLTKETVTQLRLYNNPLTLWQSKYTTRKLSVKVTLVGLCQSGNIPEDSEEFSTGDTEDLFENPKFSLTEVASLNNKDFHLQSDFGEDFKEDDMLIFQCTVLFPEKVAYLIDLYIYSSRSEEGEPPHHVGFSYLLPSVLQSSEAKVVLPVTSTKHRPLGEIKIGYTVIKPMPNIKCDMSVTYTGYWRKTRSGLEVGHRGSGASFKMENCSEVRENTIASFKNAIEHGADFLEFDVQLSKDLVPTVYHDFYVCISMKTQENSEEHELLELPIKELTLDQLHLLKVYHVTEKKTKSIRFLDQYIEEHQPFPTLRHILEVLDPLVGFNIEIKWTMQLADGSYEVYHPTDINLFLDTILEDVFLYGGSRRIIFSCFNPDVCAAIKLKQNKYPVMFLTVGESKIYDRYEDPRCWSIPNGVQFANMVQIFGLCVHSEDLFREPLLVQFMKNAGLTIFCWGDHANPIAIKYLKELGVHGIIFDKICQNSAKNVKQNIFLIEARDSEAEEIRQIAEEIVGDLLSSPPISIVKDQLLNVEKAREDVEENLSTATSFESLESELSGYVYDENDKK